MNLINKYLELKKNNAFDIDLPRLPLIEVRTVTSDYFSKITNYDLNTIYYCTDTDEMYYNGMEIVNYESN